MSRASVLALGRRAAEAGMIDTCTITRISGTTTDQDTGVITPTTITVYAGHCRIQQGTTGQGDQKDVGEADLVLLRVEVQLPTSVTGLDKGDQVLVNSSVNDPDLTGRTFRIRDLSHKTEATARRVQATEVT